LSSNGVQIMPNRFASALDDCLERLRLGESLENCLERYPKQRDELELLLGMASRVSASYVPAQMAPQSFSRGRAQFLSEAVQIKEQETPVRTRWFNWGSRPMLIRGLATIFIALALMASLFTGGNIVSANSLPGDALYGVKRTSERVQLLLTLDAENKGELEQRFNERRVDEVRQVLEKGRQVDVDFSGVIDRIEGDTIIVAGIPVRLDPQIVLETAPAVGEMILVTAAAQDDGSVQAVSLATVSSAGPETDPAELPVPIKDPTPTEVKEEPTEKPTSPPEPTETQEPTPTYTQTIAPTATIAETATITPTATLSATLTATPTLSPTPSITPEPTLTPTPPPPPRSVKVRIEGRIDEISDGYWKVSGQKITVRSTTSIKEEAAKAEVGGWAVVTAEVKSDGSLVAKKIEVLQAAEQPPKPIEFSGEIQEIGTDAWVIAGKTVAVDGDTVIEGTPRVGAGAFVKAEQYADGHLVAKRISIEDEPTIVQFEGRIQAIGDTQWTIAGQTVIVNGDTQIDGDPQIGAIAEVEAVVQDDGTMIARSIRVKVLAEPTATPSPTPEGEEPRAVPTEEPTQAPTEIPEATSTPESGESPEAVELPALPTRSLEGKRTDIVHIFLEQEAE